MNALEWPLILEHLSRMGIALALALPLGWERGKGRHAVGLRTFPITAMACCGYGLIARNLPGADAESMTRLIQGLAAGIGFIGGGVILRREDRISGLATAASIWTTGAIGIAVAFGRFEIGIALSAANFASLVLLSPSQLDRTLAFAGLHVSASSRSNAASATTDPDAKLENDAGSDREIVR